MSSGLHKIFYRYCCFLTNPWPFDSLPELPDQLISAWNDDGLNVLEYRVDGCRLELIVTARADVADGYIPHRLKGRLQHTTRLSFHLDYLLASVGQSDRGIVTRYVRKQVDSADLIDPVYRKRFKELRFQGPITKPGRGKHRCIQDIILHIVLVASGRYRMSSSEARKVAAILLRNAEQSGMDIFEFSMMPDHAHILLRPRREQSPVDCLEQLKTHSAQDLLRVQFWQPGGYSGTVGPIRLAHLLKRIRG